MKCKRACLVVNPRAGQNIARLTDVIAVLAAAGWKTKITIKEYGGHAMELATKAAEEEYDLIIAYGGDGTLNNVVSGVMNAKGQHSTIAIIPGGTTNVWAAEVGIPVEPVKAALAIVNSETRKVDIGHVELETLTFPGEQSQPGDTRSRKIKPAAKAKHHFLLMSGLGIDAAIMGHVSKPLKYKIGPLAVGVSAAKELPFQHAFPIEIHSSDGRDGGLLWKGEAQQVIIGNTRRYANFAEMTPDAYIDDGILDVCVITAGDPLTTMQQITSLLLRRKPDNLSAEYFHGAHLSISVPASINLQLDGSAVKLKDYLSRADRQALQEAGGVEQVKATYRFDALPRALRVAIPYTYADELFEDGADKSKSEVLARVEAGAAGEKHAAQEHHSRHDEMREAQEQEQALAHVESLLDHGRKVKVIAASPDPARKSVYIVAGTAPKQSTGEDKPVAVCIDAHTTMITRTGEHVAPSAARELREGGIIVVEGKQSKRGVIQAKRVVIV